MLYFFSYPLKVASASGHAIYMLNFVVKINSGRIGDKTVAYFVIAMGGHEIVELNK